MYELPTSKRTLLGVALIALLVRGLFLATSLAVLSGDPDGYRAMAIRLRATGEFTRVDSQGVPYATAYRPPLYPALLALVGNATNVPNVSIAVLHTLLGAATVVLTFLLAQRLAMGRASWLAAGLVLCDPILLEQSRLVMTETLATFLGVLALWRLVSWSQTKGWQGTPLAGVIMGLAVLCRPVFLVWMLLSLVPLAWAETTWRGRLRSCGGFVLAALFVLAPWMVRNYQLFQRPLLTTTHGGYTLLLGNNAFFYRFVRAGHWNTAWNATEFQKNWSVLDKATSPEEEWQTDQLATRWAWGVMNCDSQGCGLACMYRQWQLWSPLPNQIQANESKNRYFLRYAVGGWYLALYGMIVAGWRWWRTPLSYDFRGWFVTLVLAIALVHTFYWTNLRMRAPLIPGLAIAAAACFCLAKRPQSNE